MVRQVRRNFQENPFIKVGENNDSPRSYADVAYTAQNRQPRPQTTDIDEYGRREINAATVYTNERPLPQRASRPPRMAPTNQGRGAEIDENGGREIKTATGYTNERPLPQRAPRPPRMAPTYQGSGAETETENQGAPRQDQRYFLGRGRGRAGAGAEVAFVAEDDNPTAHRN